MCIRLTFLEEKMANGADMFKNMMGSMKVPQIDKDAILANHRKNLEALTEANRMAADVMQSISQLQSQYVKKTFDDFNKMFSMAIAKKSEDSFVKTAQQAKDGISNAVDHTAKVANMISKSSKDIYDVIQKRMADHNNEWKNMSGKSPKGKSKH